VIGILDNLLRPFLMSGKSSMNGLLMFISLLGGASAFGFIGLVLGPVVAAIVISVLQVGAGTEEEKKS
jgi:predicted PurR-regulated permease PerM